MSRNLPFPPPAYDDHSFNNISVITLFKSCMYWLELHLNLTFEGYHSQLCIVFTVWIVAVSTARACALFRFSFLVDSHHIQIAYRQLKGNGQEAEIFSAKSIKVPTFTA